LRKCLIEIETTFKFEELIPKLYRRDHKPFQKGLPANLLRKCLIENEIMFKFEELIPKLYRRDHKPFQKTACPQAFSKKA